MTGQTWAGQESSQQNRFFFTLGGSHKVGGMRIKVSAEQFAQTEGSKGRAVLRECEEKISTFFLKCPHREKQIKFENCRCCLLT